jgi:hypothetical protein
MPMMGLTRAVPIISAINVSMVRAGRVPPGVANVNNAFTSEEARSLISRYSRCHMSCHTCSHGPNRVLTGITLYPTNPAHAIINVEACRECFGDFTDGNTDHQACLEWYLNMYPEKTYADVTGYYVREDGSLGFNSGSFNQGREAFKVEQDLIELAKRGKEVTIMKNAEFWSQSRTLVNQTMFLSCKLDISDDHKK